MSSVAVFYLISKIKFEEYCQLACRVFPANPDEAIKEPSIRVVMGTNKLAQKKIERIQELWNFLSEFGEKPYVFKWNGVCLSDAVFWLQKNKNLDLCQNQFKDASGLNWILFDEPFKDRHLELLNPANFEPRDFVDYVKWVNRGKTRDPLEAVELATEYNEAMRDGIKILYDYLSLVDSDSIVMLKL